MIKTGLIIFGILWTLILSSFLSSCVTATATPPIISGEVAVGEVIEFGGIRWRVLEVRRGLALILSEDILTQRQFHTGGAVTWESSAIRVWLNEVFVYEFSEKERERIADTRIFTDTNPWFGVSGGGSVPCRLFLLSLEEVLQYFGDSRTLDNRPSGAFWFNDNYGADRIAVYLNHPTWWWLRSPGQDPLMAARVDSDGTITVGGTYITRDDGGVRPALWLILED